MFASLIVEEFDKLTHATQQLITGLRAGNCVAWMPEQPAFNVEDTTDEINRVAAAVGDFWYRDGQEGRESRSYHGLVGVPEPLLDIIDSINAHKTRLKSLIGEMRKISEHEWLETKSILNDRKETVHESLRFAGLSRLHLKQTWRQIPTFRNTPKKVGMNWYTSGKSIKRITVEDALKLLRDMDTSAEHIIVQIDQASRLGGGTALAQVQPQAPVMRANLVFDVDGEKARKAMNCSMPVFFPIQDGNDFPSHNEPPAEPPHDRVRQVRSDKRIADEPFLPSIRVHMYL